MSFGAIDFGLIVDGAVFIVEADCCINFGTASNLPVLLNFHNGKWIKKFQVRSQKNGALLFLVQPYHVIVYLPTFALQGIEGKMFIPMAQTVAFALLGAFVLSLTYVPMMSALTMSKTPSHKRNFSDKMMSFFETFFISGLCKRF